MNKAVTYNGKKSNVQLGSRFGSGTVVGIELKSGEETCILVTCDEGLLSRPMIEHIKEGVWYCDSEYLDQQVTKIVTSSTSIDGATNFPLGSVVYSDDISGTVVGVKEGVLLLDSNQASFISARTINEFTIDTLMTRIAREKRSLKIVSKEDVTFVCGKHKFVAVFHDGDGYFYGVKEGFGGNIYSFEELGLEFVAGNINKAIELAVSSKMNLQRIVQPYGEIYVNGQLSEYQLGAECEGQEIVGIFNEENGFLKTLLKTEGDKGHDGGMRAVIGFGVEKDGQTKNLWWRSFRIEPAKRFEVGQVVTWDNGSGCVVEEKGNKVLINTGIDIFSNEDFDGWAVPEGEEWSHTVMEVDEVQPLDNVKIGEKRKSNELVGVFTKGEDVIFLVAVDSGHNGYFGRADYKFVAGDLDKIKKLSEQNRLWWEW